MFMHSFSMGSTLRMALSIPAVVPRAFAAAIAARLRVWADRRRQRRILAELEDHQLADVGISRADAASESAKPFWR